MWGDVVGRDLATRLRWAVLYESYDFSNLSADIRLLFADTCARVGVDCRVYPRRVKIYRRASVALMREHVGAKL